MKRFNPILVIGIVLVFVGCAVKPVLTPVSIFQLDIGKDGTMYFEMTDSHQRVVTANRTNLPGIHHDVDELNYLPMPLVQGTNFLIHFDLQHIDVYRETSGGAAAAAILVGGLLGGALMEESCIAEFKGAVSVSDTNTGEQMCTFAVNVKESASFRMNNIKKGYTDATQQALSELVKQIVTGLTNC